jgi:hypothetical protein
MPMITWLSIVTWKCKSYYYECLIKELGINNNTSGNTTYKPTSFDKDEILANHRSFMTSLSIPYGKESEDLLSFKQVFNLSCGRVVYRVEKSSFDGGYLKERS